MFKKGTKSYSIFKLKCPRCHNGDLFINKNFFAFHQSLEMPDKCQCCKQDFKIEPGFYTIALWISYPILMIFLIPLMFVGLIFHLPNYMVFIIVLLSVLIQVPLMRIARAISLNIFISYDHKYD